MQFVVLFGGQILIVMVDCGGFPMGWQAPSTLPARQANWISTSARSDLPSYVWAILIGGTCHNLVLLGTDQVAIQRYMTATSLKTARRSMWLKLVISLPAFSAFYLTGLVLFAFYHNAGVDPLAAGQISKADQILPYFVVNELPSGLPGLLIAGVFAARCRPFPPGINSLTR